MGDTDIDSANISDLNSALPETQVNTSSTDGQLDQKETTFTNSKWAQQLGYYRTEGEFKRTVDIKATWTVGKGFTADDETTLLLDTIRGFGKDTFNTILENCVRVYHIGGDSFCEIIRDDEDNLINLKPLDPGVMRIVTDRAGIIKRYEQTSKVKGAEKPFSPERIFHLPRNRVADEIHGQSMIPELEDAILRLKEAKVDWQKVLHRNVSPARIWHLDTDDTTEISAFIGKVEAMVKDKENIFIPKGTVEVEVSSIAPNATLNPLPWIQYLEGSFYDTAGVPGIIVSSGKQFIDAAAKVKYLAWQQTIEEEQLFLVEQILAQLNLVIKLTFPASLEQGVLSAQQKEGPLTAAQPSDTEASIEGAT